MNAQSTGITESLILLVFLIMVLIAAQLFKTTKGIKLSNQILGILFSLLSIQILLSYLTVIGVLTKPHFIVIDDALLLGVGPLLLLYTKTAIGYKNRLGLSDISHFIPLIILLVPFLFFLVTTTDYSEWLLGFDLSESLKKVSMRRFQLVSFTMLTHINVYLVFAAIDAQRSEEKSLKTINYSWVMYTLISFQIINVVSYFQVLGVYFFVSGYQYITFPLILITLLAFLISIVWRGMNGSPLFTELKRTKYENSKLGEEEKNKIQRLLERAINDERVYLDADITIKTLAEMFKTHPKKVSQVINELFGKSFYDLMNHHRVNHARQLLSNASDQRLTVSEIQYQSGFNSKSSFHTQFKKKVGVSPKEFREGLEEKQKGRKE